MDQSLLLQKPSRQRNDSTSNFSAAEEAQRGIQLGWAYSAITTTVHGVDTLSREGGRNPSTDHESWRLSASGTIDKQCTVPHDVANEVLKGDLFFFEALMSRTFISPVATHGACKAWCLLGWFSFITVMNMIITVKLDLAKGEFLGSISGSFGVGCMSALWFSMRKSLISNPRLRSIYVQMGAHADPGTITYVNKITLVTLVLVLSTIAATLLTTLDTSAGGLRYYGTDVSLVGFSFSHVVG
jgi:hypothetical protein